MGDLAASEPAALPERVTRAVTWAPLSKRATRAVAEEKESGLSRGGEKGRHRGVLVSMCRTSHPTSAFYTAHPAIVKGIVRNCSKFPFQSVKSRGVIAGSRPWLSGL